VLLGTGTPAPIIMKGMGLRNRLITQGFTTSVVVVVTQRIRRRRGRRPKKDYAEYYDEYKITAFLIDINGKELVDPIINKVSKLFETSVKIDVEAKPTNVTHKQSNDFKVWVSKLSIRRDEE